MSIEPTYAWYVRVPDLSAFIRLIASVLEARLAVSPATGHTGERRIDLYNSGPRLHFEQGRLATVDSWRAPAFGDEAQVDCPPQVFPPLLFSYRSLADLRAFFPDVWANAEGMLLIDALFPVAPSTVQPLGNV